MNQKTIHFNAEMDQERVLERLEASADALAQDERRKRLDARREASTARYVARLRVRDAAKAEQARRTQRRFAGGRHAVVE